MKKILFMLIMLMTTVSISAQKNNESQKIDSLQYQLEKLQHNYDYLECEYQLSKLVLELNIYVSELRISANSLFMNIFHGGYDEKVYQSNKETYESYKDILQEKKELIFDQFLSYSNVDELLKHAFANYVIQTCLDECSSDYLMKFTRWIEPHLDSIKNSHYFKKIQSKLMYYK